VKLKLKTPKAKIKRDINSSLVEGISKLLNSHSFQSTMIRETKNILARKLSSQPEYIDLVKHDGQLRKELGVVDGTSVMEQLIQDWCNSTVLSVKPPRLASGKISGTIISLMAIKADYQDVLSQVYASYETEKDVNIPWLEWLLTKGQEIMVINHKVRTFSKYIPSSRTGTNTIMIKAKGKGWGVPIEYSGTLENNFATRAVVDSMPDIQNLFITQLSRIF
jgi:hypothetical protein